MNLLVNLLVNLDHYWRTYEPTRDINPPRTYTLGISGGARWEREAEPSEDTAERTAVGAPGPAVFIMEIVSNSLG